MSSPGDRRTGPDTFETLLRSVDPNVPLNGEKSVEHASLDEARLWTGVYREVVDLEERVLATIVQRLPSLSPGARTEAESTNVPLISGQLERFRHRLQLWEARARQLESGDPQAG
ncbi:MAG: hypothetical protein JOY68_08460 [Candidatus Dormibacteraeota bacterium]|nr:hypothetical protein [Candidatus Dormibacteraeota bacterium]